MTAAPTLLHTPERTGLPWFMFALFTFAFFIALHDPVRSYSIGDDYLPSEDTLQKDASQGNAKRQIGFLLVGGFGALMLAMPGRRPLQVNGFFAGLIIFFVLWLLLSIFWADEWALTARRWACDSPCPGDLAYLHALHVDAPSKKVVVELGAYAQGHNCGSNGPIFTIVPLP